MQRLGAINQLFGLDLLKSLQNMNVGHDIPMLGGQDNFIFSPFNIGNSLAILLLGADEKMFNQLLHTLHYEELFQIFNQITLKNQHILHSTILKTIRTLKNYKNTTVRLSYGIYPDKRFKVDRAFAIEVSKYYGTHIQKLNYKTKADEAVKTINSDIAKATKGVIKDILPRESLNPDTRFLIVDTIYFKSEWKDPFKPEKTYPEPFTRDDGVVEQVKMMHDTRTLQYGAAQLDDLVILPTSILNQKIEILRIPYANPNLAMFFVLPEKHGLSDLIKVLSPTGFTSLTKSVKDTLIDVSLPVFRTSYALSLSKTLKNLGLKSIFEDMTNFTGLIRSHKSDNLYLGEVFHKASIEVTERGTKAIADTGAVMLTSSRYLPSTQKFIADRPFLYFILDSLSGNILFFGTYIKG
ncbi:unnamed protein product [Gordionus sp. m RMFG-2023]